MRIAASARGGCSPSRAAATSAGPIPVARCATRNPCGATSRSPDCSPAAAAIAASIASDSPAGAGRPPPDACQHPFEAAPQEQRPQQLLALRPRQRRGGEHARVTGACLRGAVH